MSEIFISYAREDKGRVEILAKALQANGWSVWWDPHIPTGKRFDQVIEEALTEAKCIIVVWSKHSISSRYVRAEASEGADREVLLPVMIDDVKIPLVFRQIQTARLVDWHGSTQDPEFEKLVKDIEVTLDSPATPPKTGVASSDGTRTSVVRRRGFFSKYPVTIRSNLSSGLKILGVVGFAALIGFVIWIYNWQLAQRSSPPNVNLATPTPQPSPTSSPQNNVVIRDFSDLVKNIAVTRVAFFKGECSDTRPDESVLQTAVERANLSQTRAFVEFEFPKTSQHIDFILVVRFSDLSGRARGEMSKPNVYVQFEWVTSWHCSDPGLDRKGSLAKGSYYAEVYVGEFYNKLTKVGARRIDVY